MRVSGKRDVFIRNDYILTFQNNLNFFDLSIKLKIMEILISNTYK